VDYERNHKQDTVYSLKMKAGKRRTYFFDVRRTKGDDYYLTLTESTKKMNGDGYERHKIFLYKEDFNRFSEFLQGAIDHVKTELMPDYDYDEFNRSEEEEGEQEVFVPRDRQVVRPDDSQEPKPSEPEEDDMTW
jgi:hypothetical protein